MILKLLKDKNIRLIFGQKEIEIIKKQLWGLELTQSEKNRLSRDIRPKLSLLNKYDLSDNEIKLSKSYEVNKLLKKVVSTILSDDLGDFVKGIVLFGSHAKGNPTFNSDIDVCVIFDRYFDDKDLFLFRSRISGNFDDDIDIQVFQSLPIRIKKTIALDKKILYRKRSFDLFDDLEYVLKDDTFKFMSRLVAG